MHPIHSLSQIHPEIDAQFEPWREAVSLIFDVICIRLQGFPVASAVKMQETWVRSLGREDSLEKEMATHSSIFAWRILWTEEPGGLQSIGSQRVRHNLATEHARKYWIEVTGCSVEMGSASLWDGYGWVSRVTRDHCQHAAISSVQFNSVTQSCLTLCDPMNRSTPGLHVHHQLPEFTQTHIHRVSDAIQPSHPLPSPSPPAPNPSQHQSLFQCNNSFLQFLRARTNAE